MTIYLIKHEIKIITSFKLNKFKGAFDSIDRAL